MSVGRALLRLSVAGRDPRVAASVTGVSETAFGVEVQVVDDSETETAGEPSQVRALVRKSLDLAEPDVNGETAPTDWPVGEEDERWNALLFDVGSFSTTALARVQGARLVSIERLGSTATLTIEINGGDSTIRRRHHVPLDPSASNMQVGVMFDLAQQLLEEGQPIGEG